MVVARVLNRMLCAFLEVHTDLDDLDILLSLSFDSLEFVLIASDGYEHYTLG